MAPPRRLLLAAAPQRALAEMALLVLGLGLLTPALGSASLGYQSVFLLLAPLGAFVCALRLRPPAGPWWRQAGAEGLAGLLAWVLLFAGCLFVLRVVLRDDAVRIWPPPGTPGSLIVLSAGGMAYAIFRGAVRAWLVWDRLRRRRLLWALTHAHLTVVAVVALLVAGALVGLAAFRDPVPWAELPPDNPVAPVARRLLVNVLPVLAVVTLGSFAALLAVLPPAALVSFLVARRTTRRVERLAAAAEALRAGDYGSRVPGGGEDELARLQGAFNAMAAELQRTLGDLQAERDRVAALLEARRQLVAAVSHELRTPVATIRGYLEASLARWDEGPSGGLRDDLAVMERETERLQRLIDDLFTLARADAGGLPLALGAVDAAGLAQRVAATAAPLAWGRSRVTVMAEAQPGTPPALADPARLEQALVNLVRNAVRHTPPGGIVAIAVSAEVDAVLVAVRDTGEGIAADELSQVWEPFYRGAHARAEDAGGAGLGLALVRELTEAMGGAVAVESAPGAGSCFTLRLPLAAPVGAAPAVPEPAGHGLRG
jgi:signal transduction histidine kinase